MPTSSFKRGGETVLLSLGVAPTHSLSITPTLPPLRAPPEATPRRSKEEGTQAGQCYVPPSLIRGRLGRGVSQIVWSARDAVTETHAIELLDLRLR